MVGVSGGRGAQWEVGGVEGVVSGQWANLKLRRGVQYFAVAPRRKIEGPARPLADHGPKRSFRGAPRRQLLLADMGCAASFNLCLARLLLLFPLIDPSCPRMSGP